MPNDDEDKRTPIPPYVTFTTFRGVVGKFKEVGLPQRVDSSVLRSYSGSVSSALRAGLKFLGLTSENDETTEAFQKLVAAYDTEAWHEMFQEVLTNAYRGIIGDLNLEKATADQLNEKLRATGAESSVLQKCAYFYVSALEDAGVKVSPFLKGKPRGRPPKPRGRTIRAKGASTRTIGVQEAMPAVDTEALSVPLPGGRRVTLKLPEAITKAEWETVWPVVKAYVDAIAKNKEEKKETSQS